MLILECTKKLADQLKVNLDSELPPDVDPFYAWHANLFMHKRYKCAVLMNNETRYCIVLLGMKKEQLKHFGRTVILAVAENFLAEGFTQDIVERYLINTDDIIYSKTHDRRILGQMNDMIFMSKFHLQDEEISQIDLGKILNKTPFMKFKYFNGIEGLRERLGKI